MLGFGPALWARLAPGSVPDGFHDYTTIEGLDGTTAPGTQRDVWVWVHGTGEDVAFDAARGVGGGAGSGGDGRARPSPPSSTRTAAT